MTGPFFFSLTSLVFYVILHKSQTDLGESDMGYVLRVGLLISASQAKKNAIIISLTPLKCTVTELCLVRFKFIYFLDNSISTYGLTHYCEVGHMTMVILSHYLFK